jgi:hypothetical protein
MLATLAFREDAERVLGRAREGRRRRQGWGEGSGKGNRGVEDGKEGVKEWGKLLHAL